jgi:hypothetical protein
MHSKTMSLPGTYNVNYTYPTHGEVDYFVDKGMTTFRSLHIHLNNFNKSQAEELSKRAKKHTSIVFNSSLKIMNYEQF